MRRRMVTTLALAVVLAGFLFLRVTDILDALNGKRPPSGDEKELARLSLLDLNRALKLYQQRHGEFPSPIDGLRALVPELYPSPPEDPWGRRFRYELTRDGPIVSTLGRDGRPGGSGDDEDLALQVR